jgi:hypothetical protein
MEEKGKPAFAFDDVVYTKDAKYRATGDSIVKEHDLSEQGFERIMQRNFVPDDNYTSYNSSARKHWDGFKSRQEAEKVAGESARKLQQETEQAAYVRSSEHRQRIEEEYKGSKFKKETIQAPASGGKTIEISGQAINGLIVHKLPGGKYAITHAKSGSSLGLSYSNQALAKIAAHRLSKVADWTQPKENLDLPTLVKKVSAIHTDPYSEFP